MSRLKTNNLYSDGGMIVIDEIMDTSLNKEELIRKFWDGDTTPLEDEFAIPEVALLVRDIEANIEFLKKLKKKRSVPIDDEIAKSQNQVEFFKSIMADTLKESGSKSKKFPGVCRVGLRDKKPIWVIDDEASLIEVLKSEKEFDTIIEVKQVVNKKELNILLDTWRKIDKVPTCVHTEGDGEQVFSITMLSDSKPRDVDISEAKQETVIPHKSKDIANLDI